MTEEKNNFYFKTYKYPLFPTAEQESILNQWMASVRWVYNAALQQRHWYNRSKDNPDPHGREAKYKAFNQSTQINFFPNKRTDYCGLKNDPGLEWICETPKKCLEAALVSLDDAYNSFFNSGFGYPTPKTMDSGNALEFSVWNKSSKHDGYPVILFGRDSIKVPKIGRIRYNRWQKFHGELRSFEIVKQGDKWFACVSTRRVIPNHIRNENKDSVGIDLGVTNRLSLSNGEFHFKKLKEEDKILEDRIDKIKSRLDKRMKRGSNRRKKLKKHLNSLTRRRTKRRTAAYQKLTTEMSRKYKMIAVEDLKIDNMTKSAKGTIEEPGKNVKAKSGLNREILSASWGQFRSILEYKSEKFGFELKKVDPQYTSQRCNSCGHIQLENRDKEKFICKSCGHEDHADTNAAKNILFLANSESVARLRKRQVNSVTDSATRTPSDSKKLPGITHQFGNNDNRIAFD